MLIFSCLPLPRHQDPVFAALSTVFVGYLSNHQSWGKSWQPVSVLLHNGYILPNILATVSSSPYINISPKGKATSWITAEQEDLPGKCGFAGILWLSFVSLQNLFKSWESQNMLAYEIFQGIETKKKKKKNHFELKFSAAQPMCQGQPPMSPPPKSSPWHSPSPCRQSSKLPHSQSQQEKWCYCEDYFRSEHRPKPKTGSAWYCLAVLILSLGCTVHGNTLLPNLPKRQTTTAFYTKSNAKGRRWAYWFLQSPADQDIVMWMNGLDWLRGK